MALYYQGYYTHALVPSESAWGGRRFLGACRDALRRAILSGYYGYPQPGGTDQERAFGALLGKSRSLRLRATAELKELLPPHQPGGVVLDIGCGRGDFLVKMKSLGFGVIGIEPDPVSAALAESRGIRIIAGSVFEAGLAPASVDHITMNHSLEHVHEPVALLSKCREWLKPGGTLRLYTPNADSLGRRLFSRRWFAFDVPRHLYIFSAAALKSALRQAGFQTIQVYSFARLAPQIYDASMHLRHGTLLQWAEPPRARGRSIFSALEKILGTLGLGCGEELAGIASP